MGATTPVRALARRVSVLAAGVALAGAGTLTSAGPAAGAVAQVAGVSPGVCGSVLLAGSAWLGGQGVDVRSNGQYQGEAVSCGGTNQVNGVPSGYEWQCTELVNRLYLTRGWITSTWHGNGGRSAPGARDSMYDEAPGSLRKQPNGSITGLGPGDVVSINVFRNNVFQPDGHVLVVNTVSGAGVSLVSQNGGGPGDAIVTTPATLSGGTLTIPSSGGWSYQVIGVVHAPAGPPPDGTFVQLQGTSEVYEMAGGAPVYVSRWAAVGGSHPVQTLTAAQWHALAAVPRNGTFIRDPANGATYEVAGGAPVYLNDCSPFGGCPGAVNVDPAAIANAGGAGPWSHLLATPANGTFLRNPVSGATYAVAGGAPLYLNDCAPMSGCPGAVNVDPADFTNAGAGPPWNHLLATPANGTFLRNAVDGWIGEVVGGALFHLSPADCTALDCAAGPVNVDPYTISSYRPAHRLIGNGTFVRNVSSGWIGEAVGGALLHLSPADCTALGCAAAPVNTTGDIITSYRKAHRRITNRTFVRASGRRVRFRAAGGALLPVRDCKVLGHCAGAVLTTAAIVASYRAAHRRPRRGTILQGRPSRTFWVIRGRYRYRYRSRRHRGAVAVDDSTLRLFIRR